MNPHTYSKKTSQAVAAPVSASYPGKSLIALLLFTPISTAIAFAFLVFAAGSVLAMTAVASPEIAQGDYSPMPGHVALSRSVSEVLGETTGQALVNDAALEAGDPAAGISAKPVSFDTSVGRWNYKISYSVANVPAGGTLTIGSYVVAGNVTTSGSVETGAILKPKMLYHLSFWITDSNGARQRLARLELKTQNAKTDSGHEGDLKPCPLPSTALSGSNTTTVPSMLMCVKNGDGVVKCPVLRCMPLPPIHSATSTSEHSEKNSSNSDQH